MLTKVTWSTEITMDCAFSSYTYNWPVTSWDCVWSCKPEKPGSPLGIWKWKVIPILCTGCGKSTPTAPFFPLECALLYFKKSLSTFIFLKVVLFSSHADYFCKIMLIPPFAVSTVPHRTLRKVEVNLSVYFLYLLALNKFILIFYKSVWALSVNILRLCFGNQD